MVARSDGSFWLTLPVRCRFVLIGPNGRMSEPEGSCGATAGSFRDISSVGTYHDTLWVWDRAVGRLNLFTGDDPQPRRMLRLDFPRTSLRGSQVPLVAALLKGQVVLAHRPAQPTAFAQDDTLAALEQLMMLSLNGRGTLSDLTLHAASNVYTMHVRRSDPEPGSGEAFYSFSSPFPPAAMMRVAQDGSGLAILHQDESLSDGKPPTFTVSVFGSTLRQLRSWSVPFEQVPTIQLQAAAARADFRKSLKRSGFSLSAPQGRWADSAFVAPRYERPVVALGALYHNKLWLKRNRPAVKDANVLWQQLDVVTGRSVFVNVPSNVELIGASDEVIVALEYGPKGPPSVVAFRLEGVPRERQHARHPAE
jgi:hypothetical protein